MTDTKKGSGKGMIDITFHYTKEDMVRDLLKFVDFKEGDVVLDAGSGKNKVWYKNLPDFVKKYECEIEDGCDFFQWNKEVDWVVGNPPYKISWKFTEKSMKLARKGIAFLISIRAFNSFTPRRLEKMAKNGFYFHHIHIVADKRWYGRYYFVIIKKEKNDFFTWELKSY